ncbi:SDR family NAD(P)-dependent oxidoreductase [Georgenia sp. Z1491]|uniref:SDR family NAD(P)-dependent oxidoreductase n=1 Tax=Georgenia sp. Z1491 TaxID=3416707 RepID=UPI003CE9CA3F
MSAADRAPDGELRAGTALVTGATSGIGAAIAEVLARRGVPLVLVARSADRLRAAADRARTLGSPDVRPERADLLDGADLARVAALATQAEILVNAAGMGTAMPFPAGELADEQAMLDLNVRSLLTLSHAAAGGMRRRGSGRILNVGSTAAIWSAGTYAGSKAWVHATTAGLRSGLADDGVSVTLLVPGFTRSEFHARSATDASGVASWMWLTPEQVACAGVEAMLAGRAECVPGRRYRALVWIARRSSTGVQRRLLRAFAPLRPALRQAAGRTRESRTEAVRPHP